MLGLDMVSVKQLISTFLLVQLSVVEFQGILWPRLKQSSQAVGKEAGKSVTSPGKQVFSKSLKNENGVKQDEARRDGAGSGFSLDFSLPSNSSQKGRSSNPHPPLSNPTPLLQAQDYTRGVFIPMDAPCVLPEALGGPCLECWHSLTTDAGN